MANVDCRIARALQSYTITYPSPDETLLASPQALPTSEPATPQIEFTIGPQHLPTVSPAGLTYTLTAILYAAGQNTDGAQQTVYYRLLKNGESLNTGSAAVPAGQYYTWNFAPSTLLGITVGDVLAVKLWATSANVNWRYKALACAITRAGPAGVLLVNLNISTTPYPVLTRGNPAQYGSAYIYLQTEDKNWGSGLSTSPISMRATLPLGTYRLCRLYYGDFQSTIQAWTHVSYWPYYYANRVPTAISFRPLTIRV